METRLLIAYHEFISVSMISPLITPYIKHSISFSIQRAKRKLKKKIRSRWKLKVKLILEQHLGRNNIYHNWCRPKTRGLQSPTGKTSWLITDVTNFTTIECCDWLRSWTRTKGVEKVQWVIWVLPSFIPYSYIPTALR